MRCGLHVLDHARIRRPVGSFGMTTVAQPSASHRFLDYIINTRTDQFVTSELANTFQSIRCRTICIAGRKQTGSMRDDANHTRSNASKLFGRGCGCCSIGATKPQRCSSKHFFTHPTVTVDLIQIYSFEICKESLTMSLVDVSVATQLINR